MNVVVIPIRSGSKEIKDKNIKMFCGKPLFYWTVKKILALNYIDKIIVSSDSQKYLDLVHKYFKSDTLILSKRIKKLATSTATTDAVVMYELLKYKIYNGIVGIVEVTSPLLPINKLSQLFTYFNKNQFKSSVLVSPDTSQFWGYKDNNWHKFYTKRKMRQNNVFLYKEIGAWATSIKYFFEKKDRVISPWKIITVPSELGVPINSIYDFKLTEIIFKDKQKEIFNYN